MLVEASKNIFLSLSHLRKRETGGRIWLSAFHIPLPHWHCYIVRWWHSCIRFDFRNRSTNHCHGLIEGSVQGGWTSLREKCSFEDFACSTALGMVVGAANSGVTGLATDAVVGVGSDALTVGQQAGLGPVSYTHLTLPTKA